MSATTHETEWLPYEPMFAVCTTDGQKVREPVMRRKNAVGTWEYRRMNDEELISCRLTNRAGRSFFL